MNKVRFLHAEIVSCPKEGLRRSPFISARIDTSQIEQIFLGLRPTAKQNLINLVLAQIYPPVRHEAELKREFKFIDY